MAALKALVVLSIVASCLASRSDAHYMTARPVSVSLYYETLCGGCKHMITTQLYPAYQELSSIMDVELVPYGNAAVHRGKLYCQHGELECFGNTVQACALHLYEFKKAFDLIACMEKDGRKPNETAPECSRTSGLDYEKITECASGELGFQLMEKLGNQTEGLKPRLEFVPWVLINGVHTKEIYNLAKTNMKKLVCDNYGGHRPLACLKVKNSITPKVCPAISYAPAPVKIGFYYETLCPACKDMMALQIYPTYKNLSGIMELELVPYGNAQVKDGKVHCQHGEKECVGNMIQGCALHLYEFEQALDFIACMEDAQLLPNESAPECAKKNNLDYEKISTCVNGEEGKILQKQLGDKTEGLQPEQKYVPWITVNGDHTEKLQKSAMVDLKKLVCDLYEGQKPKECFDEGKNSAELSKPNGVSPVKIGFYYETLCPGCKAMMEEQVYFTYKELSGIMELDLVPYGNAKQTADKIVCQHGEMECHGNAIQACALDLYEFKKSFEFIYCMEDTDRMPNESAPGCAEEKGLNYKMILECANSERGLELMKQMGQKTDSLTPKHQYVPWITVDGVHTEEIQNIASESLKKVVCDAYKGPKPKACPEESNAAPVKIGLYYETMCPDCIDIISSQFYPTYKRLSAIMDLELVPFGKAFKNGDKWHCQHGDMECFGNVIQSCVLSKYEFKKSFDFIACMEREYNLPNVTAPECAQENKMDYQEILECATGKEGKRLQQKMADKTIGYELLSKYVPFVTLDGEHSDSIQESAETNLKKLVCDAYKGPKPEACKGARRG